MKFRAESRAGKRTSATRTGGRGPRPRILAVIAFSLASVVLVTAAILYPGFKTTDVDLNDGGVWVVSKSRNAVARLNYPSRVWTGL